MSAHLTFLLVQFASSFTDRQGTRRRVQERAGAAESRRSLESAGESLDLQSCGLGRLSRCTGRHCWQRVLQEDAGGLSSLGQDGSSSP